IVGLRRIYYSARRFLTGIKPEESKFWKWITGIAFALALVLNFFVTIMIGTFLFMVVSGIGGFIEDDRKKLIQIEKGKDSKVVEKDTGKKANLSFLEKAVIFTGLVIFAVLEIFIVDKTIKTGEMVIFRIILCSILIMFFLFFIVEMTLKHIHEYRYQIPLSDKTIPQFDLSAWTLGISNFIIMAWAIIDKWPLFCIMLVYWGQSVGIGVFVFLRMLFFRVVSLDTGAGSTEVKGLRKLAHGLGLICVYMIIHMLYIGFIIQMFEVLDFSYEQFQLVVSAIGIFLLNQIFSLIYDMFGKNNTIDMNNVEEQVVFRMLPMALIIFGGSVTMLAGIEMGHPITLFMFLLLKTIADVGMYVYSRKKYQPKYMGKHG
ncbi:MAG: DUF6498-containing protein, partial [Planctomycetota bacterium]